MGSSIMRRTRVRLTLSSLFQAVQGSLGVSVTPSHFYFPVPSLKSFQGKDWAARRACDGIDFALPEQVRRLETEFMPYVAECQFRETPPAPVHSNGNGNGHYKKEFHFNNGFFERVDAEIAYSFVRRYKPKRIIEVGSGNTTLVLAAALQRNIAEGHPAELTSIEPYPQPFLRAGFPGLTQLIQKPVQQVPLEVFQQLEANDILFIDSSHVVSMDSDVLYEILKILPNLAPGVVIHFHDIFTPLDYPEKFVMTNLCFWAEQYMLESFLAFNSAFRVLWAGSAMREFHPDALRQAFPLWEGSFERMPTELKVFAPSLDGKNVWPCSFWIQRHSA